jgi:hypothetical protein
MPVGNQPDVFGDVGVSRACPLTIHDFVEVTWLRGVGRPQAQILRSRAGRASLSSRDGEIPVVAPRQSCVARRSIPRPGRYFRFSVATIIRLRQAVRAARAAFRMTGSLLRVIRKRKRDGSPRLRPACERSRVTRTVRVSGAKQRALLRAKARRSGVRLTGRTMER